MMIERENLWKKVSGFVVVLTHHRTWGPVLQPYTVEKEPGNRFCTIRDSLSPYPHSDILSKLTSEEREIVKLINDYSEKHLHRLFSKESNVKKFIETLTREKQDELIRPYIEGKMFKVLSIIRDEGIPLFHQRKTTNFHSDDLLTVSSGNVQTLFRFTRNDEGTQYSLAVLNEDKEVKLFESGAEVLVHTPCVIRKGNDILFIPVLDSGKLRPFFTREFISIPKSAEEKYYSTFVLNAVNNFTVKANGFNIIKEEPVRHPRITAELGIRGIPVLILMYNYAGTLIQSDDDRESFTRFRNDNDNFLFIKHYRDKEWEEKCRKQLEDQGFFSEDNINFTVYRGIGASGDELHTLIETLNSCYNELHQAGFEIRQGSLDHKYNLSPVELATSYTIENDWFDLTAVVKIGGFSIPFVRLRKHILEGKRLYDLPDGTVAILPEAWFTTYRDIFGFGKEENDSLKIHKQHFSVVNSALGNEAGPGSHSLEDLIMPERLPSIPLPEGLETEMRPYQAEGFNWMLFLQDNHLGGCLADDMGLGKTIQALALLLHNKEVYSPDGMLTAQRADPEELQRGSQHALFEPTGEKLTNLIIVPASLLHNWENEVRLYTPALKVYTYKGISRRKATSYFGFYDIILSSYHTVRQDIDIMAGFNFNYIILDESQVIKNPASAVYKAISRLRSDNKLVLTGTPVENSLTDLWTQMNFVNPGLLGSLLYFKNEFAKPVEKDGDQQKEEKLKAIIKPFILRRTKEMVAKELPPVWEQTVYCDMTDEQSDLYEREKSAIRNSILIKPSEEESGNQAIMVLQGLMKLRQIANHPVMAADEYTAGSGKFDIVLHDLKSVTAEGHKILVFSSFVKHLNLYAEALKRENVKFSMLTGSTINREAVVNEFQNDPAKKVFLISLKAGGVGLNLTAADYVFILDPWWNPAVEMQAMNRAHRIGQDKNVFVFRYISAESIEEKIILLQERKSKIADTFINSNNPLKDLDINQILEIIG
jgi:SNF2 family DNA or RNA helicase